MSLLRTKKLTKKFGSLVAVDQVDVIVEAGTIHSVIGPNGAGKSTLFNLITGLIEPAEGQVYFKDEEITGLAPYKIAQMGIARSFQISNVFSGLTVRENVRVAAQAIEEQRDSMLVMADSLAGVNERTTQTLSDIGLKEHADQQVRDLSHGDRRKLEIGLTVVNNPELLLLDEPSAGMGKGTAVNTIRMIRNVAKKRDITIILIEHDIEIVMGISNTITVLTEGAVIAEGTPEEIRNDPEVRKAYLGGE